ncbi:alpha/beta-hydrolase [Fistulina hepatica ATCC 64428]|uniref:Alpha/beta-hydrolase n=1 Tax=Fistulina hepatica ATCC 64428 TaxID=1128425 RepID=A0A0D7ADL1_9AGAR|nr:alpha/beta-hydrolase [Fistulina hepatica ATCC 64428]
MSSSNSEDSTNSDATIAPSSSTPHRTKRKTKKVVLNHTQRKLYASERMINFRWISRMLASCCSHVLGKDDLAPQEVVDELGRIGQFSELVYTLNSSKLDMQFMFDNVEQLSQPRFPLEKYDMIRQSLLVDWFYGRTAGLPVLLAYCPATSQLVLAISGTASLQHAIYDVRTLKHRHPSRRGSVHTGFWHLYKGLRGAAKAALRSALQRHEISEVVVTGHSMGGAIAYLLTLDLLAADEDVLPPSTSLKLVAFGAPRVGDAGLAKYWRELRDTYVARRGEKSFTEYMVKAYNDGVPSLPPLFFGFRHFTRTPFYLSSDHVFCIPSCESECALFEVNIEDHAPMYPRGGHNYYNGRDFEGLNRRLARLEKSRFKSDGWIQRYETLTKKCHNH